MCRRTRLVCILLLTPLAALAQAGGVDRNRPGASEEIHIRVAEGDGAIDSIRLHRAREPVVQVLDAGGVPVPNATVTFLLPATGPSGTFQNSGLSLTLQTDANGMAAGRGLQPNRLEGQYRIRVTASWRGQAASATLQHTNAEPVGKSNNTKKIVIVALICGAAAGGAVAATHGGSSSSASIPGGTTGGVSGGATISPGTPSLGPPH